MKLQKCEPRPFGRSATYLGEEPEPVAYLHPNGWVIVKTIRSWDARGYRGSAGNPDRKIDWHVFRAGMPPQYLPGVYIGIALYSCFTRRDAVTWCDAHLPPLRRGEKPRTA